jgi:hypothetical protein
MNWLTRIARSTLARMAKNAIALTSHVVPNRRLNETRLFVSSSRKATPRTKKWGLNRRWPERVTRIAPATEKSAKARRNPSARR